MESCELEFPAVADGPIQKVFKPIQLVRYTIQWSFDSPKILRWTKKVLNNWNLLKTQKQNDDKSQVFRASSGHPNPILGRETGMRLSAERGWSDRRGYSHRKGKFTK